jgi:hypothetical protein
MEGELQQFRHTLKGRSQRKAVTYAVPAEFMKGDDTPGTNILPCGTNEISRFGLVKKHISSDHYIEGFSRRELLCSP